MEQEIFAPISPPRGNLIRAWVQAPPDGTTTVAVSTDTLPTFTCCGHMPPPQPLYGASEKTPRLSDPKGCRLGFLLIGTHLFGGCCKLI